ncbi:conserved hypothetical protein [Solidesulfovibrio fructosivorans JJ]]|uniref:Glycosyl transferase group 1 n=1 Tax=Solidesulfovibrio fructosivorans JJ] TaxID=596151 RepID=E1K166_SOLFR|nr:hypothetical protein [Solidesulfovibrio fructosivorans]EFL49626.1 conserved hypothetical protein [Solidesulfovibrio fructosivorans JJ]]
MTASVPYDPDAFDDLLPPRARFAVRREPGPPRLNICLPHLHREHLFGGMASALALAAHLAPRYAAVRCLVLTPLPEASGRIDCGAALLRRPGEVVETVSLHDGAEIVFHPADVLLCPNWRTVLVWERAAALFAAAGMPPIPFYYFILDWEPGFYPMGLKHLAAEGTYRHGEYCQAVFHSRELYRFFAARNYAFDNPVVVRPSLDPLLRAVLGGLGGAIPARQGERINVLVYGRPGHHRNCFPALMAVIAAYAEAYGESQGRDVAFVSAGTPHEDVDFGHGTVLTSLGTLTMADYAAALLQSHVGMALMASPHPSYPPLEMACFGLETLTNAYPPAKDLSREHPRIRNIDPTDPKGAAEMLAQAIEAARARAGRETPIVFPKSVSPLDWSANFHRAGLPVLGGGEAAP